MKNTFEYKSLIGSIEVDSGKLILHGRITGINDLVTYEASNLKDLKKAFQDAVDDYIKTCLSAGKEYEKSYKGTFNIRIKPELHQKAAFYAIKKSKSLNKVVEEAIEKYINR